MRPKLKTSPIRLSRDGCRVSRPLLSATPRVVREPRMLSTWRADAADFDPSRRKTKFLPSSADPRPGDHQSPKPTESHTLQHRLPFLPYPLETEACSLSLAAAAALACTLKAEAMG